MADHLMTEYRRLAAGGEALRGLSILRYQDQLAKIAKQFKPKTLLDYGCGAGDQWKQPHRLHRHLGLRWFDVRLYDPAFPDHDEKPWGKFDGVLCSDVLEHVPEAEVDELVATLFGHAKQFVWASVCCRPAKKTFPDGTNLHVTLQPLDWWREVFARRAGGIAWFLEESP